VSVADVDGLSYYSDASLMRRLKMDELQLCLSRRQLIHNGLIAYEKPLCQVLSLDPVQETRSGQASVGEIFAQSTGRPAMIDYQTYCQIRHLYTEKKLSCRQIARELKLDLKTVRKWARRESFQKSSSAQTRKQTRRLQRTDRPPFGTS